MITRYKKKTVSIVTDDGHRWNGGAAVSGASDASCCRQTCRQKCDRNIAEEQTVPLMTALAWLAATVGKFTRNAGGAVRVAGLTVIANHRNLGTKPHNDLADMLHRDPSELLRRIALE